MTISMKSLLIGGTSALCFSLVAQAQSVDYGAAEQVFGEPVTTSATGSPQRASEAPADMQIISATEIRQSGETSIPGILQRAAGIDVLNESAGQSDVNVRGYDQTGSPRLLVLINGRQVYLDHYGETVWQTLPVQLSEIRQIEVVKGPGSALFGFNAVSGVINIITYNPKFDKTNVITAQVGNNGQQSGSVATTFKLGDTFSARISAGAQKQHEWATTGALPLASSVADPMSFNFAADTVTQLASKTELRVEGSLANSRQDAMSGSSYSVGRLIVTSGLAALTSDTDYGMIEAKAYRNQLSSKYIFGSPINWVNTTTVASLQDLFKIGADHTIRIGGEFRHNSLNTAPVTGGKVGYDVFSASGMWNWAVTDQVTTTAALRIDSLNLSRTGTFPARVPLGSNSYWNRTITEPSANVTVAWRPTAEDTVRASFARGVQAPSLIELGGFQLAQTPFPGFTIDLIGNPNLSPSIVTNYELSYDHGFSWAKVGVRFFLQDWTDLKSGFLTKTINIPATSTTNNGMMVIKNVLDSEMKGVEVNITGKLTDSLSWRGDYTYTDVKDSPYAGVNTTTALAAFQSTTPKYRGNVGLTWATGAWEADINVHYVGDYKFYNMVDASLQNVKAYASLSSRVAYRLEESGVTLALSGQNLTSDRQVQTTGLQAERRVQFTLSKDW
ncbi:MAG: TonB-dependent receptor [Rhizomicrobium sp.]|nr:TonB-dependent receptor [Rhizomicrobium sp.]